MDETTFIQHELRPVGTRFTTEVAGENGEVHRHTWEVVCHIPGAPLPDGTIPWNEHIREYFEEAE